MTALKAVFGFLGGLLKAIPAIFAWFQARKIEKMKKELAELQAKRKKDSIQELAREQELLRDRRVNDQKDKNESPDGLDFDDWNDGD